MQIVVSMLYTYSGHGSSTTVLYIIIVGDSLMVIVLKVFYQSSTFAGSNTHLDIRLSYI